MEGNGDLSRLSAEATFQLQEGINLLLSRWSALEMAVQNEWGGRDSCQKAIQLSNLIFSWFTQAKGPFYIDDLEDILDDFMLSLNTEIGDGSIEEIAEKVMIMHEECLEGNFSSIRRLKETNTPRASVPHIRQAGSDDHDGSDDDECSEDGDETMGNDESSEMAVDAPESQPISGQTKMMVEGQSSKEAADALDGWTVVTRKSKGKKI